MTGAHLYEIPGWGSMSLAELIWLLSGVFTMIVTGGHMKRLVVDWSLATNTDKPVLTRLAFGYVRRELIRLAQGACITALGLWGALTPAPFGKDYISPVGIVLTSILFAQGLLVSLQSMWDWRDRRLIDVLIGEGKNGP